MRSSCSRHSWLTMLADIFSLPTTTAISTSCSIREIVSSGAVQACCAESSLRRRSCSRSFGHTLQSRRQQPQHRAQTPTNRAARRILLVTPAVALLPVVSDSQYDRNTMVRDLFRALIREINICVVLFFLCTKTARAIAAAREYRHRCRSICALYIVTAFWCI